MGAAEDIDIDLRESGGKFLYCQLELDASVAAQIPQPKRCSVSGSNFFGFPADPVVVRKEDERFPAEILSGGRQLDSSPFPLKKRKSEFPLERLDLLRDGGLGDMAGRRRFC